MQELPLQPVDISYVERVSILQALVDIFSNHEKFLVGTLQPFFESSGSLKDAPSFGIVNKQFLSFLMSNIQR